NHQLPDFKISASALALANAKADILILPPSSSGSAFTPPNTAYYGSANFSLPLYAGGKINYGIQSSELLMEASKLANEEDKSAIAYNIAQAYNNIYKAQQIIQILQENLKAANERDKTFLNLENNGVIARNDRLKANLQTSDIELKLLEAKNNFDLANINMDLLLGLPENTIINLDSQYISETLNQNTAQFYINQAIENRKTLQANEIQKKAATIGLKAAKADNLPQIALTAGYIAADVPKILTLYNAANIGIGVQYNLSNIWKKNTTELNSEIQIAKITTNQEALLDQIKLEVYRDYNNYILAENRIEVLEKTVIQANENFRITNNKYKNGLETITNLLEADASQIAANINLQNAKADAVLAYKKLEQSTGTIISK
ncbi:MAG: TolC family protein, partial [Bacteroidetes bacterium]|nr:TolC family protein [Bacteroidota bacterium]